MRIQIHRCRGWAGYSAVGWLTVIRIGPLTLVWSGRPR